MVTTTTHKGTYFGNILFGSNINMIYQSFSEFVVIRVGDVS